MRSVWSTHLVVQHPADVLDELVLEEHVGVLHQEGAQMLHAFGTHLKHMRETFQSLAIGLEVKPSAR